MRAASSALLRVAAAVCCAAAPVRAADETTNYRIDAAHSGGAPDSPVTPPLTLGKRLSVGGELIGEGAAPGLTVAIDVDTWPFEGRWQGGIRTRVLRGGSYGVSFVPRRNLRIRARLVRDERATTEPRDVFVDFPSRATITGRGSARPKLKITAGAARGDAIRKRRVAAYVAGRRGDWRLVATRRWSRATRRTVSVTFAYPRGRLGKGDRWLVCTREPVPDAFGEPTELERRCGARTLPRSLS